MQLSDLSSGSRKNKQDNDLGFGDQVGTQGERLINSDGSYNVERTGAFVLTPYQLLVELSWPRFLLIVFLFYLGVNALFALGFMLLGIEQLNGVVREGGMLSDFSQAFFFSVHTFTTVGYGSISPQGTPAQLLASFDALVGLMSFALATGLVFARFSKPKAQIIFSDNLLLSPYRDTGFKILQFRIANLRNNKIINLHASLILSWIEESKFEKYERRFVELNLERPSVNLFPLNWTIVHVIDDKSPLMGWKYQEYINRHVEFLVLIEGHDETFAQKVHLLSSYTDDQLVWNARFVKMYNAKNGVTYLSLDAISEYQKLQTEEEE